ncbi:MAG: T9SS type A sorting domain-containing protein [Bacteroidetes bacterium]|nr:T9SS type A sorting domain-containing protein [Bacteroidota bacterium]
MTGNTNIYKGYDSSGVIPKNTGAGMSWNFGSCTQNTIVTASTFTPPGSVPSATAYPGTTVVEDQGASSYNFFKSTATTFELLGFSSPNISVNFTNSAVQAVWPINFGYTNTDLYSGSLTNPVTGTADGTVTVTGSGSGTITLPGGTQFTNILQVKAANTVTLNAGFITGTITGTDYNYYHSTQKFPILTVSYQKQTLTSFGGPTVSTSADITVNNAVITGLNDKNFDATFQIFPNPAKESFYVNLSNATHANGTIEIYNSLGQIVKTIQLGNASVITEQVSLSGLSSGIYIVKTTLGDRSSARRLIVE